MAEKKTRKANPALMKPVQPDDILAEIVGKKAVPRGQLTKKVWEYIRKHDLQDKENKRVINADEKLKAVFDGEESVDMFKMTKLVNNHIIKE